MTFLPFALEILRKRCKIATKKISDIFVLKKQSKSCSYSRAPLSRIPCLPELIPNSLDLPAIFQSFINVYLELDILESPAPSTKVRPLMALINTTNLKLQHTVEPLFNEVLGITNNIFQPSNNVMYGKVLRHNEPSI